MDSPERCQKKKQKKTLQTGRRAPPTETMLRLFKKDGSKKDKAKAPIGQVVLPPAAPLEGGKDLQKKNSFSTTLPTHL
jgi:hypothetical protein